MNLSPEDKPATGFLDYPEAVLIDMARTQARNEKAEYCILDRDDEDDDVQWMKATPTHTFILLETWFVCNLCHAAEQYCECDGLLDELTRPDDDCVYEVEFGGLDPLFEDWDWGL